MSATADPSSIIPTINFRDLPSQSSVLLQAAQNWGCFRLINHPIPPAIMEEMKAAAIALLDLPVEIKRRNGDVIAGSGYMAPTEANPLYESLGLYNIGCRENVNEFCSLLEASPLQRETIMKYSKAVHELAIDIGQKLCSSMDLNLDLLKEWRCQFRMNKYHFTPESIGSSGVQIHTDTGFLTILHDDESVGGLEVMNENSGAFVAVDPLPGSLVVNFGDIAKVWSNGRFCNVRHRVMCKQATPRLSMAFFVLGPKENSVEPPVELVDAEHPRLFAPLMVDDYRELRLSTGLRAGEALGLMRVRDE